MTFAEDWIRRARARNRARYTIGFDPAASGSTDYTVIVKLGSKLYKPTAAARQRGASALIAGLCGALLPRTR